MKTIVYGATILSMNQREETIEDGTILIEDGNIADIGPNISVDVNDF